MGFRASDKPAGHRYDFLEQTDLVEQVWAALDLSAGGDLVVHDYAVTVAQELLARRVPLDRIAWLNGGVYPDLHRPTPAQELLTSPGAAELAALLTPEQIAARLKEVLHQPVPSQIVDDLAAALAGFFATKP